VATFRQAQHQPLPSEAQRRIVARASGQRQRLGPAQADAAEAVAHLQAQPHALGPHSLPFRLVARRQPEPHQAWAQIGPPARPALLQPQHVAAPAVAVEGDPGAEAAHQASGGGEQQQR
ncbi:MAG: hypothetical protein ACK55I_43130, partial [bacterium]